MTSGNAVDADESPKTPKTMKKVTFSPTISVKFMPRTFSEDEFDAQRGYSTRYLVAANRKHAMIRRTLGIVSDDEQDEIEILEKLCGWDDDVVLVGEEPPTTPKRDVSKPTTSQRTYPPPRLSRRASMRSASKSLSSKSSSRSKFGSTDSFLIEFERDLTIEESSNQVHPSNADTKVLERNSALLERAFNACDVMDIEEPSEEPKDVAKAPVEKAYNFWDDVCY